MKSLNDVLGNDDFVKRILIKRFPKLAGTAFDVRQIPKQCVECGQASFPGYEIKIEGQDEWRAVPGANGYCISCEDKRMAREAYIQHRQAKYRYLWQLTDELKGATFEGFAPRCEQTTLAFEIAEKYTKDFKNGEKYNLFWVGSYGVGKSHLSKSIAEIIKQDGNAVGFISVDALLDMIKSTFNDKTRSELEIKEHLAQLDLLVLDELGTDDQKTDWAKGTINEIVNSRNGKATIYTTNLSMKDLEMVLDGRTVDRLHQNTKIIEIYTDSFRRQQTR